MCGGGVRCAREFQKSREVKGVLLRVGFGQRIGLPHFQVVFSILQLLLQLIDLELLVFVRFILLLELRILLV